MGSTLTRPLQLSCTRSPSQDFRLFGPRPWKILATTYEQKRFLSNPDPGENLVSGNLVMETGCTSLCGRSLTEGFGGVHFPRAVGAGPGAEATRGYRAGGRGWRLGGDGGDGGDGIVRDGDGGQRAGDRRANAAWRLRRARGSPGAAANAQCAGPRAPLDRFVRGGS